MGIPVCKLRHHDLSDWSRPCSAVQQNTINVTHMMSDLPRGGTGSNCWYINIPHLSFFHKMKKNIQAFYFSCTFKRIIN